MIHWLTGATRVFVAFIMLSSLYVSSFGQAKNEETEAEKLMANTVSDLIGFEDYESAYELLQDLDSLRPNKPEYAYQIGLCFYFKLDKVKSLYYFLKARQLAYDNNQLNYYLGLAYRINYDLDNATYYIQYYADHLEPGSENYEVKKNEALNLIAQIESSKAILNQKLSVGIQNMGDVVNSDAADYVPLLLNQDSVLIFTSRRKGSTGGRITIHGTHYEDIYMSKKDKKGHWSSPKHFAGFNSKHHDANVAINKAETELYIYKARKNGSIYVSKKAADGHWRKPTPIKEINSRFWEGSIGLSPNEDTLFFSSDRPGGFGNSDLYFAVRSAKGVWTGIQNMGPQINTPLDEDSPYMYKDGKTFFFSSRGHNSVGGYDVFSTKRNGDSWTEVKNIGFPINTVDDDIYFHLNSTGSFGYFTSFRHSNFKEKSLGEKDLFEIVRPNSSPVYFVFKGKIFDPESKEPIPAIVTLKNKSDTTVADHKLVADINSGKFRFDLKFDNHYQLNIEVGDKLYFSKELYFPFQPDLFESFLDIPLKDVPSFKVKLQDILVAQNETGKVILDEEKNPTIVLVRNVPPDDKELKNLLLSNRVPMSFRKRVMAQLKSTQFVDATDEGKEVRNVLDEIDSVESIYSGGQTALEKLKTDEKAVIERFDPKEFFHTSAVSDTVLKKNLMGTEKKIIERLSDFLTGNDTTALKVIDEIYYKNLNEEEMEVITKMIAADVKEKLETKNVGDKDRIEKLYKVIDHNRSLLQAKKIGIDGYSKEAWGILYTVEASRFKYEEHQQITFKGTVTHRTNGLPAVNLKLLLTDDRGMIYSERLTSGKGEVVFSDIQPGRRYHILVNDYAISILGTSRYELKELSMISNEQEYLKFYKNLSPEQKKTVDRIVASNMLKDDYTDSPIHQWEDEAEYDKLNASDKEFVKKLEKYLSAKTESDEGFFLNEEDANQYDQLNLEKRSRYNRIIARKAAMLHQDSIFFDKLTETEKEFIRQIKNVRKARNIVIENPPLSARDADFWYILDEIDTSIPGRPKAVTISARVSSKTVEDKVIQVGFMDELGQITYSSTTDESGYFSVPSVLAGKKYKVLINIGTNISKLSDYRLTDLKIEGGDEDFYKNLSNDEKRIVDRIIATRLAEEAYQKDSLLVKKDLHRYNELSTTEKGFIDRLMRHLYADSVTKDYLHLQSRDNHNYYTSLTTEERNYINRLVVAKNGGQMSTQDPFLIKGKDKIFYDKLTATQLGQLGHMQKQRRVKADIFAENPVLIADKAWVLLDSISSSGTVVTTPFTISGQILKKGSRLPAYNVPVMISDAANNVFGIVSSDTSGYFKLPNLQTNNLFYLLAESKRLFASNESQYELINLKIEYSQKDSTTTFIVNVPSRTEMEHLIVFFSFNSFALRPSEKQKLISWFKDRVQEIDQKIITLEGHTDEIGEEEYNVQLSAKRTWAVNQFLVEIGVKPRKVVRQNFGETKPRFKEKNTTYLNRRVEIY